MFIHVQNFEDEMESFGDEFEKEFEKPADYSIKHYPSPYCEMVESLPTACFEVCADSTFCLDLQLVKTEELGKKRVIAKNYW